MQHLQGEEVPFEDAEGHLGLGGGAAHDWVQRLGHLLGILDYNHPPVDKMVLAVLQMAEWKSKT